MNNKAKVTLKDILYRVKKLPLKATVIIGEEVKEDYTVGWVKLRCSQDPVYLSRAYEYTNEFRSDILDSEEEVSKEDLINATKKVTNASVACAIEDWDEDFFGEKFSIELAMEIFENPAYVVIYNQIANYMQETTDFLPIASQQQSNG